LQIFKINNIGSKGTTNMRQFIEKSLKKFNKIKKVSNDYFITHFYKKK